MQTRGNLSLHLLRSTGGLASAIGIGLVLIASVAWSLRSRAPLLVVPGDPLNLGEGLPNETLTASAVLKNAGAGPLHIHQLDPGCGCSSLQLSKHTILPGEEVTLQVSAHLKEEKYLLFPVRIFSNDPKFPEAVLLVRAAITPPPIATDEDKLEFGEIAAGSAPRKSVKLLKPDGGPWPSDQIVTVEPTNGILLAKVVHSELEPSKVAVAIEVYPRAGLPLGAFSDTLVIRPNGSERVLRLPVHGIFVPRLCASPTTLFFADVFPEAKPMTRSIILRRTDGKPLGKLAKWTAPEGLRIDAAAGPDSPPLRQLSRLQVILEPAKVKQDLKDGKLELWLQDEKEPLSVGIMVFLAGKPETADERR